MFHNLIIDQIPAPDSVILYALENFRLLSLHIGDFSSWFLNVLHVEKLQSSYEIAIQDTFIGHFLIYFFCDFIMSKEWSDLEFH